MVASNVGTPLHQAGSITLQACLPGHTRPGAGRGLWVERPLAAVTGPQPPGRPVMATRNNRVKDCFLVPFGDKAK
jgi:hypothetical protein